MDTSLLDLLPQPPAPPPVDPATKRLCDLYGAGLSLARAAGQAGLGEREARRRLTEAGFRLPTRPLPPAAGVLRRLYVDEGRSAAEVGRQLGLTMAQVRYQLRLAGIRADARVGEGRTREPEPRRPRVSPELVAGLYVGEGLSIRAVAARTGLDQRDVWRRLTEAGVPRRPRGTAGAVLPRPHLEDLYVRRGLSIGEVARRTGVGPDAVRRNLAQYGIPRRPPVREPLPAEVLHRLYAGEELSLLAVAARLGATRGKVRRDGRLHGIACRRPGRWARHR